MRKSGIFVRTLALLCVLVFLLSATGCGGDIDAGTTTPDVTTDSTDEQAKELTIIKNGILSPSNSIISRLISAASETVYIIRRWDVLSVLHLRRHRL